MKLIRKFVIVALFLFGLAICAADQNTNKQVVYETPTIEKRSSPLQGNFNPRIDLLNADGKSKWAFQEGRLKKQSLRSELAREFSMPALNEWVDFLGKQNLDLVTRNEYLHDIESIKGFSKILQGHIVGKSNSVTNNLALLDLKLKEQKLVEEQIDGIREHPGNISSNLGDNLAWKERLDRIVNNSASVHSEFNTSLNGICNVIKKINSFVDRMDKTYVKSSNIRQPGPETQYYPNDQTVTENHPTYIGLAKSGNKKAKASHKQAAHPKKVVTTHSPLDKVALKKEIKQELLPELRRMINDHQSLKAGIKKAIVPQINKMIGNSKSMKYEIKQNLLPKVKNMIKDSVKSELGKRDKNNDVKSALDKIYQEELKIENIPVKPTTLKAVENKINNAMTGSINKISKKVVNKAAGKIAKKPAVKTAVGIITDVLSKMDAGKNVTHQDVKNVADAKKKISSVGLNVVRKIAEKVAKKINATSAQVKSAQGKVAAKTIVKKAAKNTLKNVTKLQGKQIQNAINNAAEKVAPKQKTKALNSITKSVANKAANKIANKKSVKSAIGVISDVLAKMDNGKNVTNQDVKDVADAKKKISSVGLNVVRKIAEKVAKRLKLSNQTISKFNDPSVIRSAVKTIIGVLDKMNDGQNVTNNDVNNVAVAKTYIGSHDLSLIRKIADKVSKKLENNKAVSPRVNNKQVLKSAITIILEVLNKMQVGQNVTNEDVKNVAIAKQHIGPNDLSLVRQIADKVAKKLVSQNKISAQDINKKEVKSAVGVIIEVLNKMHAGQNITNKDVKTVETARNFLGSNDLSFVRKIADKVANKLVGENKISAQEINKKEIKSAVRVILEVLNKMHAGQNVTNNDVKTVETARNFLGSNDLQFVRKVADKVAKKLQVPNVVSKPVSNASQGLKKISNAHANNLKSAIQKAVETQSVNKISKLTNKISTTVAQKAASKIVNKPAVKSAVAAITDVLTKIESGIPATPQDVKTVADSKKKIGALGLKVVRKIAQRVAKQLAGRRAAKKIMKNTTTDNCPCAKRLKQAIQKALDMNAKDSIKNALHI